MASRVSNGSPRGARKPTPVSKLNDDSVEGGKTPRNPIKPAAVPLPLQTSGLVNLPAARVSNKDATQQPDIDDMLNRLRVNDSRKTTSNEVKRGPSKSHGNTLDKLMVQLDDQTKTLKQQELDLKTDSDFNSVRNMDRSSGSDLFTPATEVFYDNVQADFQQMERIKKELEDAKSVINRQQQELEETRTFKHTIDQAMGPPSEADFPCTEQSVSSMQSAFNASARPFTSHSNAWLSDDGHIDTLVGSFPASNAFGRGRMNQFGQISGPPPVNVQGQSRIRLPDYSTIYGQQQSQVDPRYGQRTLSNSSAAFGLGMASNLGQDTGMFVGRRGGAPIRSELTLNSNATFNGDSLSPITGYAPSPINQIAPINIPGGGQQYRGMGLATSPTNDFNLGAATHNIGAGFGPVGNAQTYVTPLEPMNYRRLLDKSVSCDWKYIVDKIVCNNDQQASIFLQQKLKVGTAEQKFEIVEAIINQAYPLMINRFGNFLVQRCFEHGTPDQVVAIAHAIHGNVISLSMDPFGCHVIQKAFDSVPENHKADMVRELLRRIPDTVIHRYACHVWQKLFELRWSGEPPQIMIKVNDALRNMWHEVALGETGSLVVQNIFENCVEEEKRPAIEEVIANIDLIAHGQFGNWCIQHLCEHGSPPDKRRVIDHILTNAYSYSIDQYASKVVEKCLKIGGIEFLDRYLGVITASHPDRPRIPLIDIAGDQYGNYLIQWILMNTHQHQREQVAIHIRKHMVSLRGSKFGSRVAMLCCNPASVTRPGPGALVNPFGAPGQPRATWNRLR